MKITLYLPEDLVREMKIRAASEGRKLRDVAEEFFGAALQLPGRPQDPEHAIG